MYCVSLPQRLDTYTSSGLLQLKPHFVATVVDTYYIQEQQLKKQKDGRKKLCWNNEEH